MMRSRRSRWLIVALAAFLSVSAVATAPAAFGRALAAPTTWTFQYTGGPQDWTVPPGVTAVTFDVFGAQGGSGEGAFGVMLPGGPGGRATATLPVTPGSTVRILVGGKGKDVVEPPCFNDPGDNFNGGGEGGTGSDSFGSCGQGGGGASDVRIGGTDLANRVLVAGGGGGGSANDFCGKAGTGGGLNGGSADCPGGGGGGNQNGTSGSGQLGVGAKGADQSTNPFGAAGGGGGGGYYGGGGGAEGLGGGGGSGFGPAGTVFANGIREGNGAVVVTDASVPAITSIDPAAAPGGTVITITGTGFHTDGSTVVTFGPFQAPDVQCATATSCTAVSPANPEAPEQALTLVSVSTPQGTSDQVQYVWVPDVWLSAVAPTGGPATGGTPVTFTGFGFEITPGATEFYFGDHSAARQATGVRCTSATACTGVTPPGTGTVTVQVNDAESGFVDLPSFSYQSTGEPPDVVTRLEELEEAVRAAGPAGRVLGNLVSSARRAVESDRPDAVACGLLRGFLVGVRVLHSVGRLSSEQATQFTTEATAIRSAVGCRHR